MCGEKREVIKHIILKERVEMKERRKKMSIES